MGDTHLSIGGNKGMDIFPGWENYVERIRENWTANIKPEDTIVLVGDISWAMKIEDAYNDFSFINSLPGQKIIIKGNHDYWWTTMNKMNNYLEKSGFDTIKILHNNAFSAEGITICGSRGWINETGEALDTKVLLREAQRLEASIIEGEKLGGEIVVFIHYPPVYGSEYNWHILEVLEKHGIKRCFYGHIHGKGAYKAINGICRGIDLQLVSADFINFNPIRVN